MKVSIYSFVFSILFLNSQFLHADDSVKKTGCDSFICFSVNGQDVTPLVGSVLEKIAISVSSVATTVKEGVDELIETGKTKFPKR